MKRNLIILGILGVLVVGYYYWQFASMPTPARLTARALTASDPKDRQAAALELSLLTDSDVLPEMRRLATESKDPGVLSVCLANLSNRYDRKSLPMFVANLENESVDVRQAAFGGVLKVTSITADKIDFQPDAPAEKRGPAARSLTEECRKIQDQWANPKPIVRNGPAVAAADTSARPPVPIEEKPPPTTTKDDGSKDPAKQAPPAVTPSIAPAPVAPVVVSMPPPATDELAGRLLFLLAWSCRVLGLVVLLAEVVGAFNLVRGEARQTGSAKKKNRTHAAPEHVEKLAADKTAGQSSEITRLFAGVVCGIALILAGEMVLLAGRVEQIAARMEQKLDYLSRTR